MSSELEKIVKELEEAYQKAPAPHGVWCDSLKIQYFYAKAHEYLPALIAALRENDNEIRRLRRRIDGLQQAIEDSEDCGTC